MKYKLTSIFLIIFIGLYVYIGEISAVFELGLETVKVGKVEPSGVHGWIVFRDPVTGERWYPQHDERGLGHMTPYGYPVIQVFFERKIRKTLAQKEVPMALVSVRAGSGGESIEFDRTHETWRYALRFYHNTSHSGDPELSRNIIIYNPNSWSFHRVEVPSYSKPGGDIRGVFSPHDPFGDLPDRPAE